MNILYITKKMPFGAAEAFIFPEIDEHLRAGWRVFISPVQIASIVHKEAVNYKDFTLKADLINLDIAFKFVSHCVLHPGKTWGILRDMLSTSHWKIILRNLVVVPKAFWLADFCKKNKIEHIHAHWIAVPSTVGLIVAKLTSIPFSITAHRYDIAQKNLIPEKFKQAKFVRAIDLPGRDELKEALGPLNRDPVIVRMGVALPDGIHKPTGGEKLSSLRAVVGARFVAKKGHEILLRSIALATAAGLPVSVDLFGDGPLENRMKELASSLDIQELVNFAGVASHDELLDMILTGGYDVAVLPSVTTKDGDKEGIPVFLMESMASGLPVISTPNGGIKELIDDSCGILVPEYNSEELARAFVRLAEDGALRMALAARGKAKVQKEFAISSCAAQLRALIEA